MNVAYNMDCLPAMRQMPDKAYELAIVDPEYGIGVTGMRGGNGVIKPDKKKTWDEKPPDASYFQELFRVSKNQIIFGGNYFSLPPTRCFVIWDKGETMYGRSFAECELAWTSFDESARIFKHTPNDAARIHRCQKPTPLYEWLLTHYAKPGDKILDTHLGSGSSRIAAYNLGFDFTGYEIDADYFKAQEERFAAHAAQINLFVEAT